MVARPIAESWTVSFAVHSTVLSQAVIATEFKSVGPPQTLNLMAPATELKSVGVGSKPAECHFAIMKRPGAGS
jgi:hypothetical protein